MSANETAVREKAVQDPCFPNEEIIKEFSDVNKNSGHGLTRDAVEKRWKAPDLVKLIVSRVFLSRCVGIVNR
jgi:hypothetical protein